MEDPAAGAPAAAADADDQIKNLTLLTFACPVNWNPATRPIESSREMCTEPIVDAMNYSILYEGTELRTTAFGSDVDMAKSRQDQGPDAAPLLAGMWTIRENLQEGLEDPFAFCAIYAADGTSRLTVEETVPGGSLEILLAAGEEVNCEWYSVATVPEVIGDPNAAPSLGLEVEVLGCPAPAEFSGGIEDCTLPHPGPIAFEFSYIGQVVETGTVSPPGSLYLVKANNYNPLSGEWTIRPILPEGWIDPHFTCILLDAGGVYTGPATFFPPADGSLGVTVRFTPDQRVRCEVWVFAGDVRESVVVVTRDCPENYDAATLPPGVRKAICPGSQFRPVSVTVDDAAPVEVDSTRNGVAAFTAQPGTWRIAVDPALGIVGRAITFVTCDHTFAALGQVQTIEPTINADGRSVSIDLDEGDALRCDFFFGPAPAAAAEAPEAGEEPTDVAEAPPAADETAESPEETEAGAGDPETDQAMQSGEMDAAAETADPAPTGGTFGGGSGEADDDTGTGDTAAQPSAETTAPESTEGEGTTGEGTSELAIQHWDCPEPITADATSDDLVEDCTVSQEPSAWELSGEPLDDGDGYAVWVGLQPDTMRVTNQSAAEKDDTASAVYCSIAPEDGEFIVGVEVPVTDGAIEIVIDLPSVVYCNWFVGP